MNQHYLQLYADFIVKVGVNVRPRQNFIVRCPVTMPDFAHACVRAGYEAGAKTVVVRWEDDKLTRLNMELADEKDLTAMKPYELRSYLDYAEDPDGCCTLAIHAEDPEALAGLDAGKLNRVNLARRTFMKPWQEYTMNDRVIAVHQPFTYSRTKMLMDDFAKVLRAADQVVLLPIMGGREKDDGSVRSEDLAAKLPGSVVVDGLEGAAAWVRQNAKKGDLVVCMSCGDLYKAADMMVEK